MKKRIALFLLITCAALFSLPLFANGATEEEPELKKIVFMYPFDANSPMTLWHQKNVELFQQINPDVSIDIISSSTGDEYLTQVTTKMASGDDIDVLQGWTLARMEPFATSGRLLDLSQAFADDPSFRSFLQDDPLKATTFDGGTYGIPLETAVEGIFYNKAIFKDAGVEIPKTYTEFLQVIKDLRAAKYIPIALGNTDTWVGTIPYMMLVERIGGLGIYEQTVMKGTGSWNEKPFVKAAEELQHWMDIGAFESNVNGIPTVEGIARFQHGEAAMLFMGSWVLPTFYNDLGDNLGFFNLPTMKDGLGSDSDWIIIPNQAISLGANTEHPEVAIDFLKFMFSNDRQKELAKSGIIVTTKVALSAEEINPVQAEILALLGKATGAMYPWDVPMGPALGAELNNATANFYDGADPVPVLAALQKVCDMER